MISAFFKARKVSVENGLRDLKERITQILICLLFWLTYCVLLVAPYFVIEIFVNLYRYRIKNFYISSLFP